MKILLDECVTKSLKSYFSSHTVFTVTEMGWNGYKNGKLLTKCLENGFDIVLTIDKNISSQQNITLYNLIIVVFNSYTSKLEELKLFVPVFENRLPEFKPKNLYVIDK